MALAYRDSSPQPRLWTADEYLRAAKAGIFGADEKLELLLGEVVYKVSPQGVRHSQAINKLTRWLVKSLPAELDFFSQATTQMSSLSVPEPDFAVLKRSADSLTQLPSPEDVLMVIEVSDTTLRTDRETKARIYGGAGISEYWILNLRDDAIEVFREPTRDGYGLIRRYQLVDVLQPPFGSQEVLVSDLMPKRT